MVLSLFFAVTHHHYYYPQTASNGSKSLQAAQMQ